MNLSHMDLWTLSLGVLALVAVVAFWYVVFRKAGFAVGHSILLTLGMMVLPFTIIVGAYFVLKRWPVQVELASLRSHAGVGSIEDAWTALADATQLESKGDLNGALAGYRAIIDQYAGMEPANDATRSIERLLKIAGH
jgi:hypothetical protein